MFLFNTFMKETYDTTMYATDRVSFKAIYEEFLIWLEANVGREECIKYKRNLIYAALKEIQECSNGHFREGICLTFITRKQKDNKDITISRARVASLKLPTKTVAIIDPEQLVPGQAASIMPRIAEDNLIEHQVVTEQLIANIEVQTATGPIANIESQSTIATPLNKPTIRLKIISKVIEQAKPAPMTSQVQENPKVRETYQPMNRPPPRKAPFGEYSGPSLVYPNIKSRVANNI